MLNKTRIYDDKISINNENVKNFFNKRASLNTLNAVLLGNQQSSKHSELRNQKELSLLKSFCNLKDMTILDIGCGMGRWASNLQNDIKFYQGIDFCENFIIKNNEKFKNNDNIKFITMSASNLDLSKLNNVYDLIIMNGVLMYLNDNEIEELLKNIRQLAPKYMYIQESISILKDRLTLKDFYSEELKTQYSAIYRTKLEYESYCKKFFSDYKIKETGLLLDEITGARKETNAQYWFIISSNNK